MRWVKGGSSYLPSKDLQMKFNLLIYILETPPRGMLRGVPPQLYGSLCTYYRVCVFSSVKIYHLTSLTSCRKDQSTGKCIMCKKFILISRCYRWFFQKCDFREREREKKSLNSTEIVKYITLSKVGGLGPVCVFPR